MKFIKPPHIWISSYTRMHFSNILIKENIPLSHMVSAEINIILCGEYNFHLESIQSEEHSFSLSFAGQCLKNSVKYLLLSIKLMMRILETPIPFLTLYMISIYLCLFCFLA